jgi:hypothetical protein
MERFPSMGTWHQHVGVAGEERSGLLYSLPCCNSRFAILSILTGNELPTITGEVPLPGQQKDETRIPKLRTEELYN